ncbi:uncharacterized protein LOC133884273 isoform X2 [Phragmites australis]|uniref:uncharacterized protein LOC133884273 isoform X2 n=1 Tax=Phragmites australis TaxID=29695 RepID=UPI002D7712F4|nr:uncharacterized protein LOC133884273 isoform X2 [Phragmites australis]
MQLCWEIPGVCWPSDGPDRDGLAEGSEGLLCTVDTMIIQAIGLLDDLDKELNTYAMRVREWVLWKESFDKFLRIAYS